MIQCAAVSAHPRRFRKKQRLRVLRATKPIYRDNVRGWKTTADKLGEYLSWPACLIAAACMNDCVDLCRPKDTWR